MKRVIVTVGVALLGLLLAGVLAALATMGIHDNDTRILASIVFGMIEGVPIGLVCLATWERMSWRR